MGTTPTTKDEVLKKLIARASDSLVIDVYDRIQADRRFRWTPWSPGPGAVKSWAELVDAAVREGVLTPAEGALVLAEAGR